MWKELSFWFQQPSININNYDRWLAYLFAGMFVFGIILRLIERASKYPLNKKAISKFARPVLDMGLVGLIWFGLRYENAAFFSDRWWAGLTLAIFILWLIPFFKFMIVNYGREKRELDRQLTNQRYIPSNKK